MECMMCGEDEMEENEELGIYQCKACGYMTE